MCQYTPLPEQYICQSKWRNSGQIEITFSTTSTKVSYSTRIDPQYNLLIRLFSEEKGNV